MKFLIKEFCVLLLTFAFNTSHHVGGYRITMVKGRGLWKPMSARWKLTRNPATKSSSFESAKGFIETSVVNEQPMPGRPVVLSVDQVQLSAVVSITVDSIATERAFAHACDAFNKQVQTSRTKIPGFAEGAVLPPYALFELFSQNKVIEACVMFLQKEIFTECKKIDLPLTGKGKVYNFHPDRFNPGQPHTFELECDIIAPIKYLFPQQYRGLNVNIMKTDLHRELLEKVKLDMLEKHRNFIPVADQEKRLALDDGAMITFEGYTIDANGEKGQKIPQINQGQMSRILMQKGRLMQGLLEGLLGAKSGENRVIKVKFEPKQNGGDQRIVEGMDALLDVTVVEICRTFLPEWNQEFAGKFRKGLSIDLLEHELLRAVEMSDPKLEAQRDDEIAKALLKAANIEKVPPKLVESHIFARYQEFMKQCKDQGFDGDQMKELATDDNYSYFKERNRAVIEESARLGIIFRDVAMKENLTPSEEEIREQMVILESALKGKVVDVENARSEIESVLTRKKVFDYLGKVANIKYIDMS